MWVANRLALSLAGARAVRLVPIEDRAFDPRAFDGLLIGGGDDINAQLYGGVTVPDIRIDPERDALELDAIEKLLPTGKPILGVCRGAQMLNVALGGTLHADIHEIYAEAPRLRTVLPRKEITIRRESRLHDICKRQRLRVNSLHHQAVDQLGQDLSVAARDRHGMIQAIEGRHLDAQFLLGVQWHPEFMPYKRSQLNIFRALVHAVTGVGDSVAANGDAIATGNAAS